MADNHTYFVTDAPTRGPPGAVWVHNLCVTTQSDSLGRIVSVSARIKPADLNSGTRVSGAARKFFDKLGYAADDVGHIIGRLLGGKGGKGSMNVFAQNPTVNRGAYAQLEHWVASQVKAGKNVKVDISLIYQGASKRSSEVIYKVMVNNKPRSFVFKNI